MAPHEDPNAIQSWMLAIPAAVQAISIWYVNRSTKKTVAKSDVKTEEVVSSKSDKLEHDIRDLSNRVTLLNNNSVARLDSLEKSRGESEEKYLFLVQGYKEALENSNKAMQELAKASKVEILNSNNQPLDKTKVLTPEEQENYGKVHWKK